MCANMIRYEMNYEVLFEKKCYEIISVWRWYFDNLEQAKDFNVKLLQTRSELSEIDDFKTHMAKSIAFFWFKLTDGRYGSLTSYTKSHWNEKGCVCVCVCT